MAEVEKVFSRFDANGDGRISASELESVVRALGGSDVRPEELRGMMEEMDADRDGFVNLQEFAAFHRPSAAFEMDADAELRDAFEMYDLDRNGRITAEELHLVLRRLGDACSVADCSRMIRSVDADGDGSVSFDEFKNMMTKNSNNSNNNAGSGSGPSSS